MIPCLTQLSSPGMHCLAVVDAAAIGGLVPALRRSQLLHQSLYSGVSAITLEDEAPYLVDLNSNPEMAQKLINAYWGKSKFIFVNSPASFAQVRIALKKKLFIQNEQGDRFYFRFYDPRVLRRLGMSSPRELSRWIINDTIPLVYFEMPEGDLARCGRSVPSKLGRALQFLIGEQDVDLKIIQLATKTKGSM